MSAAPGSATGKRASRKDRVFTATTLVLALCAMALPILIAAELARTSGPSLHKFGWAFVLTRVWDPVHEIYGALPFIYGTVVSSLLALLLAVPLGLGAAFWLVETAPRLLRRPVGFLLELLAAIPSVVYGLWGIFVLVPLLRDHLEVPLTTRFPDLPLLSGEPFGIGMLSGGLILTIMVVPFIISASQQVLEAVPNSQREAALALGATKYEMMRTAVLPYARSGVVGAIMLGLGRALGETMAITMVIGNVPTISLHLFSPAYTMASVLANEFSEASSDMQRSALLEVALLLFVIAILVNLLALLLIKRTARGLSGAQKT
jgi:phosphate transport system permease protein